MLRDPALLKVHCETHDDLVLIWATDSEAHRHAEYVQVKAGEPDKLFSVADLCKKTPIASTYQRSLERDRCAEESRFRIITLRQVAADVKVLTLPRGSNARGDDNSMCTALCAALEQKHSGLKSPKGNGPSYWVRHCQWEEGESRRTLAERNLLELLKLSLAAGCPLLPEQANNLLDDLRLWVKEAGAAKWDTQQDKKIILSIAMHAWWAPKMSELSGLASMPSGSKLLEKMSQAGLPTDMAHLAIELRRDYSARVRTAQYMQSPNTAGLRERVRSELMSLRAKLVAGELQLSGPQFHALCISRLDAIDAANATAEKNQAAFLKGCMYDIVDRCLMRFTVTSS
jgi:hypothetical protein